MVVKTIVVFTAKSINRLLREGGTSSWRLDSDHARQCTFAVCTRNAKAKWVEGHEAHHSAFLIGKVRDVVLSPAYKNRYLVQFSEYAQVDIPDVWKGERNPVKYIDFKEIGIDPKNLNWRIMSEVPIESSNSIYLLPSERDGENMIEGRRTTITVNRFERDPSARCQCIKLFGAICSICDFNFAEIYGGIGMDFIHVHHLKPLAAAKGSRKVDPQKDLRPVCPNCHEMLHKRKPPFTIVELKAMIKKK